MKCTIKLLSHPTLQFSRQLQPNFSGAKLPGAEVLSASGTFGQFTLQEFDGGNFVIRYCVIDTNEPLHMNVLSHHSGLHAVVMLRNTITPVFQTGEKLPIKERQFTIVKAQQPNVEVRFPAKQHFICFEVLLSPEFASSVLEDFPELLPVLMRPTGNHPDIWVNPAGWTDEEVGEHIRYILNYSCPERWRRTYFENRVWDIVWKLVINHLNQNMPANKFRQREEEAAYMLQRLILDNLSEHVVIKDLAHELGSCETTLKRIFRTVFGMPIHKYRIYNRLKLALRLLSEGERVKEVAAKTGWRSADLIKAYKNVYGTTPGASKKKP